MADAEDLTDDQLSEVIFKILVKRLRGRSTLRNLEDALTGFQGNLRIGAWLKKYPDKFLVYADDRGHDHMAGVRVPELGLCIGYVTGEEEEGCLEVGCGQFHLCRKEVSGHCGDFGCLKDHSCTTAHNEKVAAKLGLEDYSDEDRMTVIRCSLPQVCQFYNTDGGGICPFQDRCCRIHVCRDYVTDTCAVGKEGQPCKLAHDFRAMHERRLLQSFNLDGLEEEDIKPQLIVFRRRQAAGRGLQWLNAKDLRKLKDTLQARACRRDVNGGHLAEALNEDLEVSDPEDTGVTDEEMALILSMEGEEEGVSQDVILEAIMAARDVALSRPPSTAAEAADTERPATRDRDAAEITPERDEPEAVRINDTAEEDFVQWMPRPQREIRPKRVRSTAEPQSRRNPDTSSTQPLPEPMASQAIQASRDSSAGARPKRVGALMPLPDAEVASEPLKKAGTRKRYTYLSQDQSPQDDVEAICLVNLVGLCPSTQAEDCPQAHIFQPYLWQLQPRGRWLSLPDDVSSDVERKYCDPGTDTATVQIPDEAPVFLRDHDVCIDFQTMQGHLSLADLRNPMVPVRRLSTPSYLQDEAAKSSRYATRWNWYHRHGEHDQWIPYVDKDLQTSLEKRFLRDKKSSATDEDGGNLEIYDVTFRIMRQTNPTTGQSWEVRRRPVIRD